MRRCACCGCRLPSRKVGYDDAGESCEHLVQQLTARPGELTLLATGPLTNLADAERRQPVRRQQSRATSTAQVPLRQQRRQQRQQ